MSSEEKKRIHVATVSRFQLQRHGIFHNTKYDHYLYHAPLYQYHSAWNMNERTKLRDGNYFVALVRTYTREIDGYECTFATLHNYCLRIFFRHCRKMIRYLRRMRDPRILFVCQLTGKSILSCAKEAVHDRSRARIHSTPSRCVYSDDVSRLT